MEGDPLVGSVIGNYRVTGLLGKGGMGTVYRAEHPDIGRNVAIKVVSAQFSIQPAVMARFKAEALSVNKIGHPNIIDISDFGMLADGRPYFVMELLDGEDLGKRLQRVGILPGAEAASILRQTLDALGAAHAEGIIHRDLKPDNIYLARKRGLEQVKLLDFGIAKLRQPDGGSASATADGTLLGTPLYMSPEQSMGRMSEIGPASDIYSMGIILYQMFTGRLPFEYESFGELLVAHASEPPPPPRSRHAGLDPRLEPLILKCLEKKPADRFTSAEQLAEALASIFPEMNAPAPTAPRSAAAPIVAAPVAATVAAELAPPARAPTATPMAGEVKPAASSPKPRRWAFAALALLVLGVAGGAAAWLTHRGPPPLAVSQTPVPSLPGPLLDGRELAGSAAADPAR